MQTIKLNLIPGTVAPVCYASQGDVGLAIRFLLFDGETALTLSGTEVITLAIKKADGSELEESVTNTGSNYVDVITTADTCDTPGASLCELRFQDGGDDLGTGNFIMEVEADAYAGANLEERTASGSIANFETNLQDNLTACKCTINPLQSGTGTPSPSNPRPISGFSGANIVRCGVNLLDSSVLLDQVAWHTFVLLKGKPNTAYTISSNLPSAKTSELACYVFNSTGNPSASNLVYSGQAITVTTNADGIVKCQQRRISGTDSFANYEWQLEQGTPATAYKPYNGTTTAITFGQTVYGGVLDITNGKLTITHKGETFTSVVNGGASSSTSWWGQLLSSGAKPTNNNIKADVKASYLETVTASQVINTENDCIGVNTNGAINIKIQGMTSLADYNTYLASNPLTVVYELATPTEITLTPKQIEAFVGINNVYHDCNGETEVGYLIEV